MANAIMFNIVIAVKNNLRYTKDCLASILSDPTKIDFVVTVVDDYSTDETPKYLKKLAKTDKRVGVMKMKAIETSLSEKWNTAAIAVEAKYVIILNNDTKVPHGWLDRIAKVFDDNAPTVAMIAPCVTKSLLPINVRDDIPATPVVIKLEKFGPYPSGVCYAIKQDIFTIVNMFDQDYSLSGEDADLCFKLWDKGFDIIVDEAILLWHAGGATSNMLKDKDEIWKSNGDRFLKKWKHKFGPVVDEQSEDLIDKMVSVICICHYDTKNLDRTFTSIRAQTHHNFECLVVNCYGEVGSSIVDAIGNDPRFKVFNGKSDGTIIEAVKTGIEAVSAESSYICFVHEGDLISPHAIRGMINSMKDDIGVAYSGYRNVNDDLTQRGNPVMNVEFSHIRMIVSPVITQFTMYRADIVREFVKNYVFASTFVPLHEMNYELSDQHKVVCVKKIYYDHTFHDYTITNCHGIEYAYDIKKHGDRIIEKRGMVEQGYYISTKVDANLTLAKREKLTCGNINERNDVGRWVAAHASGSRHVVPAVYSKIIEIIAEEKRNPVSCLIVGKFEQKLCTECRVMDAVEYGVEGDLESKVTDFTYNPFVGRKFDCIVCIDVLQYLTQPHLLIECLLDSLTDDGIMIVGVPDHCGIREIKSPPLKPVNFWRSPEELTSFLQTYSNATMRNIVVCSDTRLFTIKKAQKPYGNGTVTAIVLSYNREQYIGQCLDSILGQTYGNLKIKVFDDGSTDKTCKIVYDYIKRGCPVELCGGNHVGVAQNFRRAYDSADTPFVCGIDSDDWIAPRAFEHTIEAFRSNPLIGVTFSDYIITESDGKLVHIGDRSRMKFSKDNILDFFMSFQFRMIHTEAYKKMDKSDFPLPNAPVGPDYDFSVRLSEVTEFKHVPLPLYYYRQHDATINSTKKQQQIESSLEIIKAARRRRGQVIAK